MIHRFTALAGGVAASAVLLNHSALAAEDFQIRYNVAGSLGGEMFAPPEQAGVIAGVAVTRADIRKVTGNDGQSLTMDIPAGTVPLPSPTPSSLYPNYSASKARIDARGPLTQVNLGLGYVTRDAYGDGRIVVGVNIPYATKRQDIAGTSATPSLNWNPAVPSNTQAAVQSQFSAQYQGNIAAQAAAMSGEVSGLGDVELQGGWLYTTEKLRVLAGGSLVLPTGRYKSSLGPDIGAGNFYTFRPAVQAAYLPRPDVALAGKVTVGINTTNQDNNLRSGNWVGLEAAAGYMTRVGPIGLHMIHVQQYQDDSNNVWGASRLRTSNAGVFFTTMLPFVEAPVTVQYMSTLDSRNSKAGDFYQVRVIKVF